MKYRLFYHRCWLTPAMQEKVRKERSESPDTTTEIKYRRKKVVEDREFCDYESLISWDHNQTKFLEDIPSVKESYIDLWGFIANPPDTHTEELEVSFLAEEQELPLT